jgi:hypothetical protein
MRAWLLVMLVACAGPSAVRPIDVETVPTNADPTPITAPARAMPSSDPAWKLGPGGFPVPGDADGGTAMPHNDTIFQVPRPRDEVHQQLLHKLAKDGFVLDQEQFVMGGFRMTIHRDTQEYFVSVTENEPMSTLYSITAK